jgi:hypothetical protein
VQPLFTYFWRKAPSEHIAAVDRAITIAQIAATSSVSARETATIIAAANGAANASKAAFNARNDPATPNAHGDLAVAPADAAANAAKAAETALNAVADVATHVAYTAYEAADEAIKLIIDDSYDLERAAILDYELLFALAKREGWSDSSRVDPALLGALWPYGLPKGWPIDDEASDPSCLKFEIISPAGQSDADSAKFNQRVAAFFAELSALHVSMGGNGLRILDQASSETLPANEECPFENEPVGSGGSR